MFFLVISILVWCGAYVLKERSQLVARWYARARHLRHIDFEIARANSADALPKIAAIMRGYLNATDVFFRIHEENALTLLASTSPCSRQILSLETEVPQLQHRVFYQRVPFIADPAESNPVFRELLLSRELNEDFITKLKSVRAYACYPLAISAENVIGVLEITSTQSGFFTEEIQEDIDSLIDRLAVAAQNANARYALSRQNAQLEALNISALNIMSETDLDVRLNKILNAANSILSADGAELYLLSDDKKHLNLNAIIGVNHDVFSGKNYTIDVDKGMVGEIFEKRSACIVTKYEDYTRRLDDVVSYYDTIIGAPLMLPENTPIGVIVAYSNHWGTLKKHFNEFDRNLITNIAKQATLAIFNSRLLAQQHSLRLAAERITKTLSLEEIAQYILDFLMGVIPCDSASIQVSESKELKIIAAEGFDDNQKVVGLEFPLTNKFPNTTVLETRNPWSIEDIRVLFPHFETQGDIYQSDKIRSWLGIPLLVDKTPIGMVSIDRHSIVPFTEDEISLGKAFTNHAAIAIKNSNVIKRESYLREQLETLTADITSRQELEEITETILHQIRRILPYTSALVQVLHGNTREIVARVGLDDTQIVDYLVRPVEEDLLIQEILFYGKGYILTPPQVHPNWEDLDATKGIKSWVCIPLKFKEEEIGLIMLEHREKEYYQEEHFELLELLGKQISIVLKNALLYKENESQLNQLTVLNEHLNTLFGYLDANRNLAMFGLLYGETVHFAGNKLGMALTKAQNIKAGDYDNDPTGYDNALNKIIQNINYFKKQVKDTYRQFLVVKSSEFDINSLIKETVERKRMSRKIEVSWEHEAQNPLIEAPQEQLRQILFVIFQNAIDALEGEGILSLGTEASIENNVDHMIITIADNGIGMSQESIDKIQNLESPVVRSAGLGLGLIWAVSFVRSFGGYITFDSEGVNKGTTVTINIPRRFGEPFEPPFKTTRM